MSYLFNGIGLLLILFVVYWFWLRKKGAGVAAVDQVIDIKVAGGVYLPQKITMNLGEEIVLRFTREDESPCAATVVFADFGQSADLPLNQVVSVKLKPQQAGSFDFTCQMGMYRGQLVVLEAV